MGLHLGHVQVYLSSAQEGIQQLLGAVIEEVALLQLLYIPAEHQAQLQGSGVAVLHTGVMGELQPELPQGPGVQAHCASGAVAVPAL